MSMAVAFDTLKYADRLQEAGVPPAQARAQVEVLTEAMADVVEHCVPKTVYAQETSTLRSEMKTEFAAVRSEMKTEFAAVRKEIAETKADLIRWVVSFGILQTALISALLIKLVG